MNRQAIEPLTRERVGSVLQGMGIRFLRDEDGDFVLFLGIPSAKLVAMVLVSVQGKGKILTVGGLVQNLPTEDPRDLLDKANAWNQKHRWPRVFLRDDELHFDYHVDLERGVSDAQLENFLKTAFATIQQLIAWLEVSPGKGFSRLPGLAVA